MTDGTVRTAVVGVGHLGKAHARILSELGCASLVGVHDTDAARAAQVAAAYGARAFESLDALIDAGVRFAVVATPTKVHFDVARTLLAAGVGVLVEKPFTRTLEEADALLSLAASLPQSFLGVGHVERFNPVVRAARRHVQDPLFLECDRVHPFSFRSMDIGVVLDLMIHDLDLVAWFADSSLTAVEAVGASVLSSFEDMASARLRFANGCTALVRASRVSLRKVRKLRIFCQDMYISLDYLARTGMKIRVKAGARDALLRAMHEEGQAPSSLAFPQFLDIEDLGVEESEPLALELEAFVSALRDGAPPPVPGRVGRDALACALAVQRDILEHQESVRTVRRGLTENRKG